MNRTKPTLYVAETEEKLDFETCKRILNQKGYNYTDEQVIQIRNYLYQLAQVQCTHFKEWQVHPQKIKGEVRQRAFTIPIRTMEYKKSSIKVPENLYLIDNQYNVYLQSRFSKRR